MSTAYEQTGRYRQKQRTRQALVDAARELVASGGRSPTVAEAAERAAVSRTTAYRYFPTQRSLLLAAHPEVDATTMLPPDVGDDPEQRLAAAVRGFMSMVVDTEAQQRTMLRLSLDPDTDRTRLPLRQGRAIGWFVEALAPMAEDIGDDGVRRLAVAVRGVTGVEPLVWLTDIAGLSREQAVEQMVWSAVALVRRAGASRSAPPGDGAG